MCSRGPSAANCSPALGPEEPDERRLALYRRAGEALDRFFARWTTAFCVRCLEVTRRYHAGDPRSDVEVVGGVFPGCCQAGVADALWVPGWEERGRFSPGLAAAMARSRQGCHRSASPPEYVVRERVSGIKATGVGCAYLGPQGCGLGGCKSPLCLLYACEPIRQALAAVAGERWLGAGTDDFAGGRLPIGLAVSGDLGEAAAAVAALETRLDGLGRQLEARGFADGESLFRHWADECAPEPAGPATEGGG